MRTLLFLSWITASLFLFGLANPSEAAKKEREPFVIAYVGLADDPRYEEARAYTGLVLREAKRALNGVETALRESRVLGRALGLDFDLVTALLENPDNLGDAVQTLVEEETAKVFVLDLPLPLTRDVVARMAGRNVMIFNPRHRDDGLRAEICDAQLLHTVPSHAMEMDGLAQYLRKKNWTSILVLEGPEPGDSVLSAAFQAAAEKFKLTVVDVKDFALSNDPRVRDETNISLLTQDPEHDAIFLADTTGEFGRYVPFASYFPRPVIGSEGLVASAWHWTWERHGAPQLNQRFDRQAKRSMTGEDWAGWAAIKVVIEALVRTESKDPAVLRDFLLSEDFTLDTYKGAPGSFRPWDGQLRQPILLHSHNAVIARAPIDGFLHEKNTLDTLGVDERESACSAD